MQYDDKFTVNATTDTVWSFITDPNKLGPCVPGIEDVQQIDDRSYDVVVKAQVGPIAARFKFKVVITEMDEPRHMKAVSQGADVGLSRGGTFNQEITVDLKELTPTEIEITYSTIVNIIGKFATFGERVMRAKAREVGNNFSKNLKEKIEAEYIQV